MKDSLKAIAFGLVGGLILLGIGGGVFFILYAMAAGFQH